MKEGERERRTEKIHYIIAHIEPMIEINFKSISLFINLPCQNDKMTLCVMKRKSSTERNQYNNFANDFSYI